MPMEKTLKLEELLKDGMYPEESAGGQRWRILHGDTLKLVKSFRPGIFDAVITDPPYASGGTKQNERNRTTNQKYSSMKPGNALPDFDGDNKDQRSWTHWMAEWLYDVRKACVAVRLSACLSIGGSIRLSRMPCSGQDGSGEGLPCGIRGTPGRRKDGSASRQNILCGVATGQCPSVVQWHACRVCSGMGIPRTGSM